MLRRRFLAAAAASAARLPGANLKAVGVQLYTLRTIINEKPLEVFQSLEQVGFRECEVIQSNMDKIWDSLKQTRLKPVSLHLDTAMFTRDQAKLPAALEDAKKRGFSFVVCPYVAPQDRGGVDVIKRLAETLTKAGETCAKSGLKLAYHNHAFEFEPAGSGTLLDVLMDTSDPKLVTLELDIMWSRVAGVDPVSVLQKYGKRVTLMHLKNVAADVGPQFTERVPREAFREVGNGVVDIPAVLKAAAKAGVQHYFVEQDQTPGNPIDSLKQSFGYLQQLSY
ncbi:MAG TPA: sugar phosphate isomerase/epimerase [Bryobacteraceae bacterium]|nr:sugar phosphate isomerase/epimerase [Bryobacteraceae bacterium]